MEKVFKLGNRARLVDNGDGVVQFIIDDENSSEVTNPDSQGIADLIEFLRTSQRQITQGGKLTITYEYDTATMDNEAHMEVKRLTKASDMAIALWNISHNLVKAVERKMEVRYPDTTDVSWVDALDEAQNAITEALEDQDIIIDELTN